MALAATKPMIAPEGSEILQAIPEEIIVERLGVAAAGANPAPSPALALQSRLEGAFSQVGDPEDRWSARRSIVFAVGSSLILWTLIGLSVRALFH